MFRTGVHLILKWGYAPKTPYRYEHLNPVKLERTQGTYQVYIQKHMWNLEYAKFSFTWHC